MRAPVRIRALTQDGYSELKRMERSRKLAAGRVKRAQIILLSNQGYLAHEIANKLSIHEKTARRWVGRFNKLGMVGLEEGPRNGRPPVYSAKDVGVVIQTALTSPDDLGLPFGSWTLDRLVAYLSEEKDIPIKRSRISEIFRHEGLRWAAPGGLVRGASGSPVRPKRAAIESLYTKPPERSVVVCIDEMGPMSACTHPGQQLVCPLSAEGKPAQRAKQELDYGRRPNEGYMFSALLYATGEAVTDTYTSRSIANFVDFLDQLEAWIPSEIERVYIERVYAVMDNLAVHKSYDVLLFSLAHPRWEFVFQPKYAAYLNLIEPWWKMLKSLALKGMRFLSWEEVEVAVREACAYWNSHRHPYVWGRRRRHRIPRKFGVASTPTVPSI